MTLKQTVDEWFKIVKDDIEVADLCCKGQEIPTLRLYVSTGSRESSQGLY